MGGRFFFGFLGGGDGALRRGGFFATSFLGDETSRVRLAMRDCPADFGATNCSSWNRSSASSSRLMCRSTTSYVCAAMATLFSPYASVSLNVATISASRWIRCALLISHTAPRKSFTSVDVFPRTSTIHVVSMLAYTLPSTVTYLAPDCLGPASTRIAVTARPAATRPLIRQLAIHLQGNKGKEEAHVLST